ncbi:hypothetical protein [Salinicoccus roseus]|uniref:hypothetical protein n=1 Tax=Salinicoccus roseus TaxID=45670 RepID=UPI0022FFEA00|nr:hypothetical protein [Salinicoccus roseus]
MFYLLISRNAFFDNDNKIRSEIVDILSSIKGKDIQVVLVTRSIAKYKSLLNEQLDNSSQVKYIHRRNISKSALKKNNNIMLIGAVDTDIRIAANNKILMINPSWIPNVEDNILKYGFELDSVDQLLKCIEIFNIEPELYSDFHIDSSTRLIAVSNANKFRKLFDNEENMIEIYKSTLKYNNDFYKYALYLHYLTVITGLYVFEDVDYWMSVPSSTGKNNNNVYDVVKQTRYLMKNQRKEEMFIRHTPAKKSTYMSPADRKRLGCSRHLETIHLNEKYKGKLKGKKICVIDDYVTNGSSFESIRNLLVKEEVKEVIFLAIGSFAQPYIKEEVDIFGDVFSSGYKFKSKHREYLQPEKNAKAQQVVNKIHEIIIQ